MIHGPKNLKISVRRPGTFRRSRCDTGDGVCRLSHIETHPLRNFSTTTTAGMTIWACDLSGGGKGGILSPGSVGGVARHNSGVREDLGGRNMEVRAERQMYLTQEACSGRSVSEEETISSQSMRLFDGTKIPVLHRALDAYTLRQKVIAGNIANITTPGYKAQSVKFEDELSGVCRPVVFPACAPIHGICPSVDRQHRRRCR